MIIDPTKPPAPGGEPPNQPRIHVDSDWKREAQAEKERLAHEIEDAQASAGAPGGRRDDGALPPPTFATLVQMLATQTAIFLSDQVDPRSGRPLRHLGLAKHHIDLLRMLEEKTRGHLEDEEKRLLEALLHDLLMAYVEAAS